MILFLNKTDDISSPAPEQRKEAYVAKLNDSPTSRFVSSPDHVLTKSIGFLSKGETVHYYSYGNFNLVRLLLYLIRQTGPVHVFMTSYSFSQKSIEQLQKKLERSEILSFKVIVDNRVKTMSPKPFQMLSNSFDYRCISIHAKVALLWNDEWKITIVTSQNATDNPKIERGVIYTDPQIFDFDSKALHDTFQRGTA